MPKVAVLNDNDLLVGYRQVDVAAADDVVVPDECDLPADAKAPRYRWNKSTNAFLPIGYGAPIKPARSPVGPDYAMYLTMKAVGELTKLPKEVDDYLDWYEKNLAQISAERARLNASNKIRGR
jgi:hypothetical protein